MIALVRFVGFVGVVTIMIIWSIDNARIINAQAATLQPSGHARELVREPTCDVASLRVALQEAEPLLVHAGDYPTESTYAIYRSPAEALREAANEIDARAVTRARVHALLAACDRAEASR